MITASELRNLTQTALDDAKAELQTKESKRKELIDQTVTAGYEYAEEILNGIPKVAKEAALNGQFSAEIIRFKSYHWRVIPQDSDIGFNTVKDYIQKIIQELKQDSNIKVYVLKEFAIVEKLMNTLHEAGLNPYVRYWYDGDGRDDGYFIGIKW